MSNGMEQPVKMYRSTTRIIPYQPDNNNYKINQCIPIKQNNQTVNGNSLLVATVNGRAVGGGNGTLYSAINSGPSIERNNRGVPSALNGESKISAGDPQVRKLVYNMYRGLLNTKHDRATDIVDAAPQQNIQTDEGVNDRVLSMMRQRSEQKEGKMNYGPPPPPPPPPFQTGAPPVRLPSEIAAAAAAASNRPQAHAPPMMMAPPAALAGAMMKDKKPFTYTPGGLNLAEINSQPEQNGNPAVPLQIRGPNDPPMQSRSFKVIQNAYDHNSDPSGPVLQPENQQSQPEPRKYVGASIPSRSFRMLQAMTDTEDVPSEEASSEPGHYRKPLLSDESTAPSESLSKPHTPIQHSNSSSPSTSTAPSPSLLTPSVSTSSVSIQCMGDLPHIGSRVAPSYTCTRDSPAYRQVVPKIIKGGDKEERVINSALSSKRENSPRPWQISDSLRSHSPVSVSRSSSIGSDKGGATTWQVETDSRPRLMNFIQAERQNSDSTSEAKEGYQLYGGNKIPSRVFQQLQNDYAENNGSTTSNGSSVKVTEVHLPRLMKHMNVDRCLSADDDTMSCTSRNSEYDDVHMNGLMETAEVKGSVLKELTSHFEPQSSLKKPRAAPGRVFRYLQQQYDDPQDTGLGSTCSSSSPLGSRSTNGSPSPLGNRSANVSPNDRSSSVSSTSAESGHFEIEPKPYGGARIPGRTFRMLQENYETHPSVMQARK